jgi:hypothetical protein
MAHSSTSFQNGNQQSVTHGIYSFLRRGTDALSPQERQDYAAFLDYMQQEMGVKLALAEHAAKIRTIVNRGMDHFLAADNDIWEGKNFLKMFGTYLAEYRRTLEAIGDEVRADYQSEYDRVIQVIEQAENADN